MANGSERVYLLKNQPSAGQRGRMLFVVPIRNKYKCKIKNAKSLFDESSA
jgi:hypothetical protein